MNRLLHVHAKRQAAQSGVASVEFALILPFMLLILFAMLLFGRIFWTYNVLQKATHDAARYMTSISAEEFSNNVRFANAKLTAQTMVADAANTLSLSNSVVPDDVGLLCDNATCFFNSTNTIPNVLTITLSVNLVDDSFYPFTGDFFPANSSFFTIKSVSMMRFVN